MKSASETMLVTIASVGDTRFDGPARSITLPGVAGEMTILPHHEPLVTTLKKGTARVIDSGGEKKEFAIESGVIECASNRVTVLL